jgi:hypothetical protein
MYQDHAVFEFLQYMRVQQRMTADPMFSWPDEYASSIAAEIAEAMAYAGQARARWGDAIADRYEWARPVLTLRRQRKIAFADLESFAESSFLRADYLLGNERIHASAYAAINHINFNGGPVSPTRPRCDHQLIQRVGSRAATFIGWMARAAGKGIAWETEEYDEFLYVFELMRAASRTRDAFLATELDLSAPGA